MNEDEKKIVIVAPTHVRAEDWCYRQTPPVDPRTTLIVTGSNAMRQLSAVHKDDVRLVKLGFPQNGRDAEAIMEALLSRGML